MDGELIEGSFPQWKIDQWILYFNGKLVLFHPSIMMIDFFPLIIHDNSTACGMLYFNVAKYSYNMLQPQEWKIAMMKSLNGGSSHLQHATTTRMEIAMMKSLNGTSSHLESG